jgi:hypothetical protein
MPAKKTTPKTKTPTKAKAAPAGQDGDRFWEIVSQSRADFDPKLRDGNMDRQEQRLAEILGALPPREIVEFEHRFHELKEKAYRWDLWAAAYIIQGGCSDDGFMDFRNWLLSMGRGVYEAALRDPESLLEVASAPGVEDVSFEGFGYVAPQVYEDKTGEEIPAPPSGYGARDPAGEPWSEEGDDLARRLPKLWAKYGRK